MKNIAIILSRLKTFKDPKLYLEQYATDSEIASEIINYAYMKGDIVGKIVMDLGCGTGVLGIGCLLLGAKKVYFIDKDQSVLNILKSNLLLIENMMNIAIANKAIICNIDAASVNKKIFSDINTVIQNPPFGTKNRKADTLFLKKAIEISAIIYSFHKYDTREYVKRFISNLGYDITNEWRFRFLLKNTMTHHTRIRQYIDVGCWRARHNQQ